MWDKVRCCWEHVVEHIGNLVNMLGTHLELGGNTLGTKIKSITPPFFPPPQNLCRDNSIAIVCLCTQKKKKRKKKTKLMDIYYKLVQPEMLAFHMDAFNSPFAESRAANQFRYLVTELVSKLWCRDERGVPVCVGILSLASCTVPNKCNPSTRSQLTPGLWTATEE